MLQGIKAIFLDIDNTLLDFNAASRVAMEQAFAACGIPFAPEMYPTFKRVNDGLWRKIETGELTRERLHATRWNLVLAALGLPGDGQAVEAHFLSLLATEAIPVEGAEALLRYLSAKYTVCIASNAPYEQQLKRLTKVGMLPYFHKHFISEKLGVAKPSREYFDRCFAQLEGITPEQTVIIGDSVTADIHGGAAYGMHTCWYDHEQTGNICPQADFSVSALAEIQRIL